MRPPAVHGPFAGRTWLVTSVPLPPSRVHVLAGLRSFEAHMAALVPPERERPRRRGRRPAPPPRVSSLRRMRGTQSEADLRQELSRPDSPASAYSEDQARCSTIASIDRILSSMHSLQAELGAGGCAPDGPLPPPAMPETIPEEPDSPQPVPPVRQLPQLDSQMSLDEMFTEIETLYDSLRNQNAKNGTGASASGVASGGSGSCAGGCSGVGVCAGSGGCIGVGVCAGGDCVGASGVCGDDAGAFRGDRVDKQCNKHGVTYDETAGRCSGRTVPAESLGPSAGLDRAQDRSPASCRARSVPADVQRSQSLHVGARARRGATLSPQVGRQGAARRSASTRTCRPPAPLPIAADDEVQYDVPRWPQPVPVHVRGPSAPAVLSSTRAGVSEPQEVVYDTPRPLNGRPRLPLPAGPDLPPRGGPLPSPPPPVPPPPPPLLLESFNRLPVKQTAAVRPKPAIPVPRPPELPPHLKTTGPGSAGKPVIPLPPKPPASVSKDPAAPLKPCLPVAPMMENKNVTKTDITVIQKTEITVVQKIETQERQMASIPEAVIDDTPVQENQNSIAVSESDINAPLTPVLPPKPAVVLQQNSTASLPATVPVTDLDNLPPVISPPLPLPPKPASLANQSQTTAMSSTNPTERVSQTPTAPLPPSETAVADVERTPSPPPVPQHSAPPEQVLASASLPPKPELPASLLLTSDQAPTPTSPPGSRQRPPLKRQQRAMSPPPPVPAHAAGLGGTSSAAASAAARRHESAVRLLEGLTAPLPPARPESPAGQLSDARRRAVALLLDDQLLLPEAPSHDPRAGPPARRSPRPATPRSGSGGRRRPRTPLDEGGERASLAREERVSSPDQQQTQRCNGTAVTEQNRSGAPPGPNNCDDQDTPPTPPPRDTPASSRGISPSPNTTLNTTSDTIGSDGSFGPVPPMSAILEALARQRASNGGWTATAPAAAPVGQPQRQPHPVAAAAPVALTENPPPSVSVSARAEKLQQQLAIGQPAAGGAVKRSPGGSAREEADQRHDGHCRVA